MALTDYPIIYFDNSGSDTAASGSGGTAVTAGGNDGASTTASSNVVDLSADSPDLSGVAQDGTAVMWVDSSSGRQFSRINTVNDGADTVTCEDNFANTESGRNWGIGGQRASLDGSEQLFQSSGDASAQWILEMTDGYTETVSTDQLSFAISGGDTTGPIILRGESGATTKPLLTYTGSSSDFFNITGNNWIFKDFEIQPGVSGKSSGFYSNAIKVYFNGVSVLKNSTNAFDFGIYGISSELNVQNCLIVNPDTYCCRNITGRAIILGSTLIGAGIGNIEMSNATSYCYMYNIIVDSSGWGIRHSSTSSSSSMIAVIAHNTINNNSGDGILIKNAINSVRYYQIINNIISNNGGYNLHFDNTALSVESFQANPAAILNNNTYNGTSGNVKVGTETTGDSDFISIGDPHLDPQFNDAGSPNYDYTIGTNLKEQGYKEDNYLNTSVRSYADIGAFQRQEPAGGGLIPLYTSSGLLKR